MERRKGKIDLLSGLPDEILLHILSFLRTKRSVCTSVLSKRWRFLWAHVPNLKFYPHSNFIADIDTQPHPLDIIIRVAMIHQAQILNTFKLKLSKVEGWSSYQLDTLIIYLLTNRNPQNLYLDLGYKECEDDIVCTLPRLLFACKTLVDLRLVNCGEIPSSGELFLPSLKKLNLSYVDYEDDESLPRLISGCPLLEELIVNVCVRYEQTNTGCVIVSSPTLKTLTVDFSDLGEECPDEMLVIDVPALEYLTVDHCNLDSLKSLEKNMNSLVEAKITLNGCLHTCGTDCTEHGRSIEFLSCLCCVSYLRISSDFGETLVDIVGTGSMPKFDNLTKLKLKLTVDWYKVVKFLELADNLEVLLISLYKVPPYTEPKRVATCMLSRLRTVTLYCFGACDDAFELVRYILRNARALEKMEIYAEDGSSDKDNFDALRRISLFERGSASCQLDFNNTKHCVRHISNEVTIRQLICKFKSIFIW